MTETTKEERDRIRRIAHALYHASYKDEDAYHGGGKAYELDWMDIHVNQLTGSKHNKLAHWGSSSRDADHEKNLGIKFSSFRMHTAESQVRVLLHEITHEWLRNHSERFFYRMVENYLRSRDSIRVMEDVPAVDWEVVKWQIPRDARTSAMEHPRQSKIDVGEMTRSIASAAGIDPDDYMELIRARNKTRTGDMKEVKNLDFAKMEPSEIVREARELNKDLEGTPLASLPAVKIGESGRAVDNLWVANLDWYLGASTTYVKKE